MNTRTTLSGACAAMALAVLLASAAVSTCGAAADGVGPGYPGRSGAAATRTVQAQVPVVSHPAPATSFENQPLAFPENPRRAPRPDGERVVSASLPSIWPALFSVVVVCGVFGAILYFAKRYLPGHRQLFSHPAMEVLGRTHIDQRRYVSLVRVGKRIIVVGVSPDEMRSLSEITDEEEITGIMDVARPKTEMGLTIFQRLFKRHVLDADAAETAAEAAEKARELEERSSRLRERVRSIHDREEPARHHLDALG